MSAKIKAKRKRCIGCSENFYNGNNQYAIKECWNLKGAKLIKRKKVGMNDRPPWTWKPGRFLNCYRQKGYVFINCEDGDRQY